MEKILKKIFRTVERNKLVENGDKIFIAMSGGKDSASAAYSLKKFVEEKNVECELIGFHINLGFPISGEIENVVKKQCELIGIPLKVINLSELGVSLEKISKESKRPICSVCGVAKRYLMNKVPREEGATKLATGHNMDDFIVFFFKNLFARQFSWISKFKPMLPSTHRKMLAKIRPLFEVSNSETKFICESLAIPHVEGLCTYAFRRREFYEKRKRWLEGIEELDSRVKGFKENLIKSIQALADILPVEGELKECKLCGEPCSGEICSFCKLTQKTQ
jgi:tRNA(Ile)-lysidine synthase TilS/MesJ